MYCSDNSGDMKGIEMNACHLPHNLGQFACCYAATASGSEKAQSEMLPLYWPRGNWGFSHRSVSHVHHGCRILRVLLHGLRVLLHRLRETGRAGTSRLKSTHQPLATGITLQQLDALSGDDASISRQKNQLRDALHSKHLHDRLTVPAEGNSLPWH